MRIREFALIITLSLFSYGVCAGEFMFGHPEVKEVFSGHQALGMYQCFAGKLSGGEIPAGDVCGMACFRPDGGARVEVPARRLLAGLSLFSEEVETGGGRGGGEASRPFVVQTPLGLSVWVFVICGLLLVVVPAIGCYWVLRRERNKFEERRLGLEDRRNREINDMKQRLLTDIGRELRVSLELVVSPLEALTEEYKSDEVLAGKLKVVWQNAVRSLHLVSRLSDGGEGGSQGEGLNLPDGSVAGIGTAGASFSELSAGNYGMGPEGAGTGKEMSVHSVGREEKRNHIVTIEGLDEEVKKLEAEETAEEVVEEAAVPPADGPQRAMVIRLTENEDNTFVTEVVLPEDLPGVVTAVSKRGESVASAVNGSEAGKDRAYMELKSAGIVITSSDEKLVGRAVKYVEENMTRSDLSVEELSRELGMSRVYLYKKLSAITGKTPIEFIRMIRLKRAARLLRESRQNVSEIAYQVGFNNPKYFSKYFKEEFGMLPSVYQGREEKVSDVC